ncbi:MAG: M28 family peptidase [Saprospiraceae bacterium]
MKLKLTLAMLMAFASLFAQSPDSLQRIVEERLRRATIGDAPDPQPFGKSITAADMKVLIDSLAGRTFAGRETGTEGQRLAADYIAAQFTSIGLTKPRETNSFFQEIALQNSTWKDLALKIGGRDMKKNTDFYVFPALCPDVPTLAAKEVVFVGYGIQEGQYNDYGKADVAGKIVVFYDGEPLNPAGNLSLITGTELRSAWATDWKKKVRLAKQKGAAAAFIIDAKLAENVQKNRRALSNWGWQPTSTSGKISDQTKDLAPHAFISTGTFEALAAEKAEKVAEAMADLRAGKGFKPLKIKAQVEASFDREVKTLEGSNVLGIIEGTDPVLKNQYVLITAHYDHLGAVDSTKIYYGADDNASGTAAVIEIAQAFAEAKKQGIGPKRTVVCMLVSGEEKGLLGSKFYTEFPVLPLNQTICNINIDMVGRVDKEHASDPNYIYVIGGDRTSKDLHDITEDANKRFTKMSLDYKYNDPRDPNHYFERSDHYNFVMKGIPATFFFNGTHDDYHKPTDTPDKINFDAAAKRAQLAFYTAWQVACRGRQLSVDFSPEKLKN